MYTTGTAFLEALVETGVEYVFCNLGSDHTSLVEAYAAAHRAGRKVPKFVTAPHEMVAMTVAHGYAQASGRAQAVVVHVDCGTQSLAGALSGRLMRFVPESVLAGFTTGVGLKLLDNQIPELLGFDYRVLELCSRIFSRSVEQLPAHTPKDESRPADRQADACGAEHTAPA